MPLAGEAPRLHLFCAVLALAILLCAAGAQTRRNSFTVYSTSQSINATSILHALLDSRVATVTMSAPVPASLSLVLPAVILTVRRRTRC